jgi:hypothetical protein
MVSKLAIVAGALLLVGAGLAAATYESSNATTNASGSVASGVSATAAQFGCRWADVRDRVADAFGAARSLSPTEKAEKRGAMAGAHAAYVEHCLERRDPDARGAAFEMSGSSVVGRDVAFNAQQGGLTDYTSRGAFGNTPIFDSVSVSTLGGNDTVKGAVYWEADRETGVRLVALDGPRAALAVQTKNGTEATFVVSQGITIVPGPDNQSVTLENQGHRAILEVRHGALTVNGDTITADLSAHGLAVFHIELAANAPDVPPEPALPASAPDS